MLKKIGICTGILVLGLLGTSNLESRSAFPVQVESPQLQLDLAMYPIKNRKVRDALGLEAIPIRARSYALPAMSLPLLKLQSLSQNQVDSQLREIFQQTSNSNFPEKKVRDLADIFTLKRGAEIYWINKASGAYTYSHNHEVMSVPTDIRDHMQAVDLALRFIVMKNLVILGPHETLDVNFVSQVMNAAVEDGEDQPISQYGADYFVGFGRRYRGVPIIGSRLILRLGSKGKLFGVQKTWRPIVAEGEWVNINGTPPVEQLRSSLSQNAPQAEQNIIIHRTVSGYIEGPVKNEQLMMGPGCIINYTISPSSEMASQELIPLASVNFPLSGTRKSFEPVKGSRKDLIPVRDRDDRGQDEQN